MKSEDLKTVFKNGSDPREICTFINSINLSSIFDFCKHNGEHLFLQRNDAERNLKLNERDKGNKNNN